MIKKNKNYVFFYIINDQNQTFISGTAQESIDNSDDESKIEDIPLLGSRKEAGKGIDIKRDTDRLTNQQVLSLIDEELFGSSCIVTEQEECNQMLASLNISQSNEIPISIQKLALFEDPAESILRREKGEHLSFQQKLYIYTCNRRKGQSLSEIWKKASLSISTAKRIIADFDSNIDRSAIYAKIRCKQIVRSPAVSSAISSFIKRQTGSFVAGDLQAHLKKKLRWIIPLQQIRKTLKDQHKLSYK